jgi:Uma2 family endonuclease
MMVLREKQYTADEFWDMLPEFEEGKRFELVEGVIVEMTGSRPINSKLGVRIARYLDIFSEENNLGHVLGADGGYTLSPHNVRIPDVSFISYARYPELPTRIEGGPDLAVEIISPSESSQDVLKKVTLYFNAGTKLVWTVYPDLQMVYSYRPSDDGMSVRPIDTEGTLDGEDVLPGFALKVSEIFK